jgi:hypothetical protein
MIARARLPHRAMALAAALLLPAVAIAQTFPAKPVRLIVPVAAGGNQDLIARGIAQRASEFIGQPMIVEVTHVPYKGNAPAIVDLVAGYVSGMYDQISTSIAHIRAGRMRPLAVTTARRSPLLPEVPTVAEAGLTGYEYATFNAVLAPAATPREAVGRLHAALARATQTPELRARERRARHRTRVQRHGRRGDRLRARRDRAHGEAGARGGNPGRAVAAAAARPIGLARPVVQVARRRSSSSRPSANSPLASSGSAAGSGITVPLTVTMSKRQVPVLP